MTAHQLRQRLIARLAAQTDTPRSYWSAVIAEVEEADARGDRSTNWTVRATCGLHHGAAIRVHVNEAIKTLREEVPYVSGFL